MKAVASILGASTTFMIWRFVENPRDTFVYLTEISYVRNIDEV